MNGYFYHTGGIPFGRFLVDQVFEPFMAIQKHVLTARQTIVSV